MSTLALDELAVLQASLVPLRVNTSESGFSEDIFTFQAIREVQGLSK